MGMGTGNCPKCGVKFNARTSSIGTVRRCENCGHKYILQATPFGCGGCITAIGSLIALGVIGGVVVIVCCGGLGILGSAGQPDNESAIADAPNAAQAPIPRTTAEVPASTAQATPPPPITVAPVAKKLTDEKLYELVDETYGLPIANLQSKSLIAGLRSQGFEGPEPNIYPDGLPDVPEAKVTQCWYLTKELPGITFHAEVIGDLRGAVRNVQFVLIAKDGKPVIGKAKELLTPVTALLNRPKVTKWYITHSGETLIEDFDGTLLESVGSPLFWNYMVKGSSSTTPHVTESTSPAVVNDYHAPRLWTDSTGTFKVTAAFVSLGNGQVKLRKEDGKVIDVPMENLSPADQAFVNSLKR